MAYEKQKQTNGKENKTEDCPKYQEKYEFKHAAHFSGRKKMLERRSWGKEGLGRICIHKFMPKEPAITSQNRTVQVKSVLLSVHQFNSDAHQYLQGDSECTVFHQCTES